MGVFTIKGVRQVHLSVSSEEIFFMDELHPGKMPLQGLCQRLREPGDPVLGPLSIAHSDLVVGKIDIFHTQAHTFHET